MKNNQNVNLHNFLHLNEKLCNDLIRNKEPQKFNISKDEFYVTNHKNQTFIDELIALEEPQTEIEYKLISFLFERFYIVALDMNDGKENHHILTEQISIYIKSCYDVTITNINNRDYLTEVVEVLKNDKKFILENSLNETEENIQLFKDNNNQQLENIIIDYINQFNPQCNSLKQIYGICYLIDMFNNKKELFDFDTQSKRKLLTLFLEKIPTSYKSIDMKNLIIELSSNAIKFPTPLNLKSFEGKEEYFIDVLKVQVYKKVIENYLIKNKIITRYETLKNKINLKFTDNNSPKKSKI